ncbi:hypothetical protein BHE74_00037022 [Ensete ventricosum]|nr:hypothetical protein BHE74_00037022 [Ensete ventricosum]
MESRVSIGFSCIISKFKKLAIPNIIVHGKSYEFRLIFRPPSRKFKILDIPNVFAHGKLYKHGFTKKCDGHKLWAKSCAKSSFDRFFVHCLINSKYWPFPTY